MESEILEHSWTVLKKFKELKTLVIIDFKQNYMFYISIPTTFPPFLARKQELFGQVHNFGRPIPGEQ